MSEKQFAPQSPATSLDQPFTSETFTTVFRHLSQELHRGKCAHNHSDALVIGVANEAEIADRLSNAIALGIPPKIVVLWEPQSNRIRARGSDMRTIQSIIEFFEPLDVQPQIILLLADVHRKNSNPEYLNRVASRAQQYFPNHVEVRWLGEELRRLNIEENPATVDSGVSSHQGFINAFFRRNASDDAEANTLFTRRSQEQAVINELAGDYGFLISRSDPFLAPLFEKVPGVLFTKKKVYRDLGS